MNQTDPFSLAFAGMAEQIAQRVFEMMQAGLPAAAPDLLSAPGGIEPMRVYTAEEVAEMLRTGLDGHDNARAESVYRIDKRDLPRVRRVGTKIGFLGINVLCYMHGLPPVDMEQIIEDYRAKLMAERPRPRPVQPLRRGAGQLPGETRIV